MGSVDPRLLEILVCPLCKGKLLYRKDAGELVCKADRMAYPVKDDISVMLEEEARKLPPGEQAVCALPSASRSVMPRSAPRGIRPSIWPDSRCGCTSADAR